MAGRQRYCEVEDKFSRSTSAILDARLQCQQVSSGSQPRDTVALDLQNTRAMTVPHRKVNDDVLNGMEVGYMEANRSGGITIAAECGLCLDEFLDTGNKVPRNLLCGHTFCTDCIKKLMFYKANCRSEVDCPKCHTITPVPSSRVDNLPKNFGLIEVISSSVAPRHHAALNDDPPQHVTESPEVDHPICRVHKDHISGYCMDDDTLVCSSCQLYGPHKGHKCLLVTEAAEQERAKLRRLNPEVDRQREKMQCCLQQVEHTLQQVEKNGGNVLDAVDTQFSLLTAALEKRRKELRVQVMERTQVRVHALMTQANDLRENVERAASVYSQTAGLIISSDFTLLQGCSLALEKVEGVFTNPPSSLPSAGPDLTANFSHDIHSDIISHLQGYGTIKSVAGTVKNITVDEYHDGFRIFWDRHSLADNEGISYHLQGLIGEHQPEENDYVILYRGGDTKFTWKKELQRYVPYGFRVQVRTTEGVGSWSSPITAFRAEPGFRWHESRRSVRIELSTDKMEASLPRSSGNSWATVAGNHLIQSGQLYVELDILDSGKNKSSKEKLVFGVIECSPSTINTLSWQECKTCVGQLEGSKSYAYHPLAGTRNCHLFPDGKAYKSSLQLEMGDRLGMLLDMDAGTLHFFHNGMDLGVAFDNIRSEWLLPAVSMREKVRIRLCFPPPPYSQRDPKIVRLSSFGVASQRYRKRT